MTHNNQPSRGILLIKAIFYPFLAVAAVAFLFAFTALPAAAAPNNEVMTDRCSSDVAIPPTYNANPATVGTIILKRDATGWSNWVPIHVSLGDSGHVRWWCHSTSGNWFDPGTWRIESVTVGTACQLDANANVMGCKPNGSIKLGSSAWNGWTAERSRCDNHSTHLRARLGPNRLLSMECLG